MRAIVERAGLDLAAPFQTRTLGEALLVPTRIYVREVLALLSTHAVDGIAHITGGGFENLQRILPASLAPRVDYGNWSPPPLFGLLQSAGGVSDAEMRRTFNLGVGMVLAVSAAAADALVAAAPGAFVVGEVVEAGR